MTNSPTYEHGAKRRNNPTGEMATTSHPERRLPARHRTDVKEKDLGRIPNLDWKRQREGKTVVAPLLSTVEKIDPAAWIETLRRQPEQGDMFGSFDRYEHPQRAKWEWYEHSGNWQNKMIALYVLGLGGMAIVSERLTSWRPAVLSVLGGALLILGLVLLKESAAPLANEPWFSEMIGSTGRSLVLAFFVGAFLTCLVQSSGVVTVFGVSLATIGIISVDQALMNMYGSFTGSSLIIYLLSLNLVGRERQVAMYFIIYNMVICATVVPMLYIEIYLGVPLIKAMMSSTGLDLGRQLSLVYIFIGIFLIPVMLVLLNWSSVQLDRMWPASQTDELSRPRFIQNHASIDVDTSLLLVDLEQQRALKNVAQYLEAVRNGESVRDLQAASQSLLMEIEHFLSDLHVVHPMHHIEEQNSLRTRQKLLFWMKDTLGLLCGSLISIPEDSALARLRILIHEGVDTVMVSLVHVMEDNDSGSWKLLRQLIGDRGDLMQDIRSQFIQAHPPPSPSELAQMLRITNLVEETFFLLTKLVQEFAREQTEIVERKVH